jgi:hypothetical protein
LELKVQIQAPKELQGLKEVKGLKEPKVKMEQLVLKDSKAHKVV